MNARYFRLFFLGFWTLPCFSPSAGPFAAAPWVATAVAGIFSGTVKKAVGAVWGWLAYIFAFLFAWIADTFIRIFATKMPLVLAMWVALFSLFGITLASIYSGLMALRIAMPSEVNMALGWFLPSNFETCLSIVVTAHLSVFVFKWKNRLVDSATQVIAK